MNERRSPTDQLLIGTSWLADRLSDADMRIVDVTPPGSGYVFGHLPGAVYLDLDDVFTGRVPGLPYTMGPPERVAATLGGLGLAPSRRIVIYDEIGGTRAAQTFWLLEYLGFEHVSVLEGGIERWMAEGRSLTRARPTIEPATFAPTLREDRLATAEWIVSRLTSGTVSLLDCRTPEEYAEGHIPGARNRSWDRTLVRRAYQAFRAADALKSDLIPFGVTGDKEIVTYCTTGVRSAHTYLTLRVLGYPHVRNYEGSWAEWGSRPELPKAQERRE